MGNKNIDEQSQQPLIASDFLARLVSK